MESLYMIYYGDTPAYQVSRDFRNKGYTKGRAQAQLTIYKKDHRITQAKLKDGTEAIVGKFHVVEFVPKVLAKVSLQMAVDRYSGYPEDFSDIEKKTKVLGLTIDDDGYLREDD